MLLLVCVLYCNLWENWESENKVGEGGGGVRLTGGGEGGGEERVEWCGVHSVMHNYGGTACANGVAVLAAFHKLASRNIQKSTSSTPLRAWR